MPSKVRNREKLARKLRALPEEVKRVIGQAIEDSAAEVVAMQKRLVPVESGELRDSIQFTMGQERVKYSMGIGGVRGDPDLSARISAGNARVRYAHIVEYGSAPHKNAGKFAGSQHPGTKAQPYFWPAWRAYRRRVRSRITRATKKAAREVASS